MQAEHLGRRLAQLPLRRITHGPLLRAAETARIVAEQFEHRPAVDGRDRIEVVITHAFTIGWVVRHALGAPSWRWWPPNQCHAGLTVIRSEVAGPPVVVVANDVSHLPADLRWTGFPDHLRL